MIKKVVVIGGGHGQSLICRALKQIDNITISAIVTVADDGGSTGRLRKQFHIPAMGDIRNVLISLSEKESVMRDLMDYRFATLGSEDIDVQGHNLGNLILTALTEETGSFLEAIQVAGDVLKVKGTEGVTSADYYRSLIKMFPLPVRIRMIGQSGYSYKDEDLEKGKLILRSRQSR